MGAKSSAENRVTVYPDPTARLIVGDSSPACNLAIECWARVLRESMPELERAEWNFLADVLNGTLEIQWIGGMIGTGPAGLALEVHDAQSLNGTGDKWFGKETKRGSGQAATEALIAKVQAMSWQQIVYAYVATGFFWDHAQLDINHQKDEWWTVPFRVQFLRREKEE